MNQIQYLYLTLNKLFLNILLLTFSDDVTFRESDLAASLVYCVADQLATNVYMSAKGHNIPAIVFVGSFMGGRSALREQFKEKLKLCSMYLQVSVVVILLWLCASVVIRFSCGCVCMFSKDAINKCHHTICNHRFKLWFLR